MTKIFKPVCLMVALALVLSLGAMAVPRVEASPDGIVNGGFESGNLTGWTIGGLAAHVEVLQSGNFSAPIPVPEGNYFVLLSTGPWWIQFPILNGDLDGNGYQDCDHSTLTQTFTLTSGEVPATLSFQWSFLSSEAAPDPTPYWGYDYDDFFKVTLNGSNTVNGSVPGAGTFVSMFPDVPLDGQTYHVTSSGLTNNTHLDDGRSPFQTCTHTITTAGTYTLEFVVADQAQGGDVDSGLLIDAILLELGEPVDADFSADPREGRAPLDVQFTDNSSGNITSWSWDFGDGSSNSTAQNPLHTYTTAGTYDVTLTVSGPGGTDNETKVNYIDVWEALPPGQGPEIPVTDSEGEADQPDVAIDSEGNVHIAYCDYGVGLYEIWYTMLDNYGNTLIDDTMISDDDDWHSRRPAIVVDSEDMVHIVWHDRRWDGRELAYEKLAPDPGGGSITTLVDDKRLTYMDSVWEWAAVPRIAIDRNDNIHIVFESPSMDTGVYYMQIDNVGDVNIEPIQLRDCYAYRTSVSVAVDCDNNAHITWNDDKDTEVGETYYMMLDGSDGSTLIDATLITPGDVYKSKRQSIVVDYEDKVHIIWQDQRGKAANNNFVKLARDMNNLAGATEIYYTKLDPSLDDQDGSSANETAITLIDDTALTPNDHVKSNHPASAIHCGHYIHITWYEEWEAGLSGYLHYMIVDTDGNTEVDDTALIVNKTAESTRKWTMAYLDVDDNGKAHIVWCDDRDGYPEVYYTTFQGPVAAVCPAPCPGEEELVADFSGSPRSGLSPLTVQFTDLSTGNPTSWRWSFGDGETSKRQNPSHTYYTPGVYTVSLRVTGSPVTDTETKPEYITVLAPRRPEEKRPPLIAPAMLSVHNLTVTPPGGPALTALVTPAEVYPNQAVTINAEVVNKGDMWGSKEVELMINGQVEQRVRIDVPAHSSQPVSFTVYRAEPGTYSIYIEGVTAYFTVLYPETRGAIPFGTGGIIALVVIGITLIIGVIMAFVIRPT